MKKLIFALLAVLILLVGMAAAGPNTAVFKAIIVTNDAAVGSNLTTGGDLSVGGDTSTTGTVSGAILDATDLTVGDWAQIDAQVALVIGAGGIITPTGSFQPLTSASSLTCSTSKCIAEGTTKGEILILANENLTNTITIDGTGGTVECKTDKALGARDILTLIWNGTDWNCISLADNS